MSEQTRQQTSSGPGWPRGLRLGRIAGVAIHLDWSLIIIFLLITVSLAFGVLPFWHPDWGPLVTGLTAVAAALLFLVSVLLHELSHAVVGRRLGMRIERITLFVFGGMAHMEDEPDSWATELKMAIAGPLMSLALGAAFLYLGGLLAGPLEMDPEKPREAMEQLGPGATLMLWLGPVNIILGVFNLVPGFPLDGGRVLRAALWGATGDLHRATRLASGAGQLVAWLLIASGFAMILGIHVPPFGSGPVAGLWIAIIGWFLNNAAVYGYRSLVIREALEDVPVRQLMHGDYATVGPDDTLDGLVEDHLLTSSQRVYPVVADGELQGMVGLEDVRRIDRDAWSATRVADVMTPRRELRSLAPEDPASQAMSLLAEQGFNQLPVVDGGRLAGLVTRDDVLKWLALSRGQDLEREGRALLGGGGRSREG